MKSLFVLAVTGCGVVHEAPIDARDESPIDASSTVDAAAFDDAAPIDAAPITLAVEGEVAWHSGNPPIALGAADDRACFLSRVAGQFAVSGGEARVYVLDGQWYVGGTAPVVVHAWARCVSWDPASTLHGDAVSYEWSQGEPPRDMGAEADRLCGLTRMSGRFEGGGELIHATVSGGRWLLAGNSATSGVAASARCLHWPAGTNVAYSAETIWDQGQGDQLLANGPNHACVMTMVTGAFHGLGEMVMVWSDGTAWVLAGTSGQVGVGGRARCLSW
jgi:hypothetical protein